MSISVYSVCSDEAEQLSSNGYKLYVDKDRGSNHNSPDFGNVNDGIKWPENKNQMIFMFETPDGSEPFFNHIYNKSEVDALIEGGISSDLLKKLCMSAVNTSLKVLTTFNALKYNSVTNQLDVVLKNVMRSSNAILELFKWINSSLNDIQLDTLYLYNVIHSIHSCECMKPGGFHDQFLELHDEFDQFKDDTETRFDNDEQYLSDMLDEIQAWFAGRAGYMFGF